MKLSKTHSLCAHIIRAYLQVDALGSEPEGPPGVDLEEHVELLCAEDGDGVGDELHAEDREDAARREVVPAGARLELPDLRLERQVVRALHHVHRLQVKHLHLLLLPAKNVPVCVTVVKSQGVAARVSELLHRDHLKSFDFVNFQGVTTAPSVRVHVGSQNHTTSVWSDVAFVPQQLGVFGVELGYAPSVLQVNEVELGYIALMSVKELYHSQVSKATYHANAVPRRVVLNVVQHKSSVIKPQFLRDLPAGETRRDIHFKSYGRLFLFNEYSAV